MRSRVRAMAVVLAALVLLPGCLGSDEPSDEQIEREREDAAEDARRDERIRQLERERARERRESSGGSGGQSPAPPSGSGRTPCGGGISAGPNTSCSFARNVRDAYVSSPGNTVEVYSPVTRQTYTMTCTPGAETVCTGGNNATVYFR